MKKKFNISGACFEQKHYLMNNAGKLKDVMALVEDGDYFVINRPRQYGKTTLLHFLSNELKDSGKYLPIRISLQGVADKWLMDDNAFVQAFIDIFLQTLTIQKPELSDFLNQQKKSITDISHLSIFITKLVHKVDEKIVLLIDEVDASTHYDGFLKFLGLLRMKYLDRFEIYNATFHSVVLAGVHDIKSLKRKIRTDGGLEFNSPWNIAADFNVKMSFNPKEIAPMLEQYSKAENVAIDIPKIAKRLHYYTAGYPFLVSKLCKLIAETILPNEQKKQWTLDHIEQAMQMLLKENNTNFDSLIGKLENNADLYELVRAIVLEGRKVSFNHHNPIIHQGVLYGIFKRNGTIRIHNRVYEHVIYNYLSSKIETMMFTQDNYTSRSYELPNKKLDIEKILINFQKFAKTQYSQKDEKFLEREWRVLLLAFIQPIISEKGYTFKEVQTSEEARLDIVITYFQHQYVVELKRWYGPAAHERGLQQLGKYLDKQHQQKGYLVIFEATKNKSWKQQQIQFEDKDIFAIWV